MFRHLAESLCESVDITWRQQAAVETIHDQLRQITNARSNDWRSNSVGIERDSRSVLESGRGTTQHVVRSQHLRHQLWIDLGLESDPGIASGDVTQFAQKRLFGLRSHGPADIDRQARGLGQLSDRVDDLANTLPAIEALVKNAEKRR